jgi:hypothetical protein
MLALKVLRSGGLGGEGAQRFVAAKVSPAAKEATAVSIASRSTTGPSSLAPAIIPSNAAARPRPGVRPSCSHHAITHMNQTDHLLAWQATVTNSQSQSRPTRP